MSDYKSRSDEVILKRSKRTQIAKFRSQSAMTNDQVLEFIKHAMKVEDFVQRGKIHGG